MITSFFKKSTPLNFFFVVFFMLVFFFIYQFQDLGGLNSIGSFLNKLGTLFIIFASLLITNFVIKRNGLSKDSSYTILFFLLLLLFFPGLFNNYNLIISNFFILLAMRRLVSLQSQKATKEKIFDASLWILVASLFHFWSILFLLMVFISIIMHVSNDYRNWFLPIISLLAVGIIFLLSSLFFDIDMFEYFNRSSKINLKIDYFLNNYQNAAFSIYATIALFFLISMLMSYSSKPLILHASFKKIIFSFLIGVLVYMISPEKSNDLLIYTIAPLSMMATTHIELPQLKLKQELVFGVLIVCSLFSFFSQL